MERIGKYIIHKLAVTSGYAQVVFCTDPDLQVPVAIKLFDPRRIADSSLSPAQSLSRFIAEARVMASVEHNNIVPIKVLEQLADGRPYFVMPFFSAHLPFEIGKDFKDKEAINNAAEHERPRHLAIPRGILLLRQISSAAAALHRRGIVHRWIKPSNLLLTAKEGGAIRLADFSMVKVPNSNVPLADIWANPGPYTAPEQLENASAVGPEADVYSIGALAFRFVTGLVPDFDSIHATKPESVPPPLWDIIISAMNPDPGKRPANAGALLPLLEEVKVTPKPPKERIVATKPPAKRASAAKVAASSS